MLDIHYHVEEDLLEIRTTEPIPESAITNNNGETIGYINLVDTDNNVYVTTRKQNVTIEELFLGLMNLIKSFKNPIFSIQGFGDSVWEAFHHEFGILSYAEHSKTFKRLIPILMHCKCFTKEVAQHLYIYFFINLKK